MLAFNNDQSRGRKAESDEIKSRTRALPEIFLCCLLALACFPFVAGPAGAAGTEPAYTNDRIADGPWSIHVVRIDRSDPHFEIHSVHALGAALGLSPLSEQIKTIGAALGSPVAGVNGDFYQRERAYAGNPRGLQIVEGELISAPSGGVSFWIDPGGQPHATNVSSQFRITWPNGKMTAFDLNGERRSRSAEIYTPAAGPSTRTGSGREIILEQGAEGPWLPLRIGTNYMARVREIREAGNSPLKAGTLAISVGPELAGVTAGLEAGSLLNISTAAEPRLEGVKSAIGGGPLLVHAGKRQKFAEGDADSYQTSSMLERHPRTAIGWNATHYFLVAVDGRQKGSAGMTLEELSNYLVKLGCKEAMNLDGGGSTTLWLEGKVRNRPCDGRERPIANSLVVTQTAR